MPVQVCRPDCWSPEFPGTIIHTRKTTTGMFGGPLPRSCRFQVQEQWFSANALPGEHELFLNYLSLAILCLGLLMVFYAFIFLHNLPYSIAKKRNHPQVEAIHVACWLSLFTFHAIWPVVYIWAVTVQSPIEVAVGEKQPGDLEQRLKALEGRLGKIESASGPAAKGAAT